MKKIRVAVLMGGKSPEYEISLISGREVVRNLPKKYEVIPIVISRNGRHWQLINRETVLNVEDHLKLLSSRSDDKINNKKNKLINPQNISNFADIVFIAMHGPFGEDGTMQGMLELTGIPYTGPGVLASALAMDKLMFRKLLEGQGFNVPKYVALRKNDTVSKVHKLGKPPHFVKPHNQGSSIGCSIVLNNKQLRPALDKTFKFSNIALVDRFVKGIEVTCAVMGNQEPYALPLVEIVPKLGEFFDYDSIYTERGEEEIVPARISKELTKKIQKMSVDIYKLIGCTGFSRIDYILQNGINPVVIELNTIPGLTPMSLFPKAAKASGLTYSKLLDTIILYGLKDKR